MVHTIHFQASPGQWWFVAVKILKNITLQKIPTREKLGKFHVKEFICQIEGQPTMFQINFSGPKARIFQDHKVNTMSADDQGPNFTRSSAAMIVN